MEGSQARPHNKLARSTAPTPTSADTDTAVRGAAPDEPDPPVAAALDEFVPDEVTFTVDTFVVAVSAYRSPALRLRHWPIDSS